MEATPQKSGGETTQNLYVRASFHRLKLAKKNLRKQNARSSVIFHGSEGFQPKQKN